MASSEIQQPLPITVYTDAEGAATQVKTDLDELLKAHPKIIHESTQQPSIYRVPEYIAGDNSSAFKPQAVSFGPYHHGDPRLLPMEEHKLSAFLYFQQVSELSTDEIVWKVSEILEPLQGSYHKLDAKWRDDPAKFLLLMILDGCFLIEILAGTKIDESHPVFSDHGQLHMNPLIGRDMLLLENQLPIKLLDVLCPMRPRKQSALSLICKFFFTKVNHTLPGESLHALDIYRKNLLFPWQVHTKGSNGKSSDLESQSIDGELIPSATEIREAGIRFEKSGSKSLTDISFEGGVLRLPRIVVDDKTESTFFNLMAFEKLHAKAGNEVTDYIYIMDDLINEGKDVALLCSKKVMVNALGDHESAAKLFNLLAVGAAMETGNPLNQIKRQVNEYCSRPWNAWCADLKHTYFQNPWALASFIAALLGFAILILQAVYDVYGYHRPRP